METGRGVIHGNASSTDGIQSLEDLCAVTQHEPTSALGHRGPHPVVTHEQVEAFLELSRPSVEETAARGDAELPELVGRGVNDERDPAQESANRFVKRRGATLGEDQQLGARDDDVIGEIQSTEQKTAP